MKRAFTLIELVVVVFIIVILVAIGLSCAAGSFTTSWGRNLQLESVEGGYPKKWHWIDRETGERFYSFESDADPLYRE